MSEPKTFKDLMRETGQALKTLGDELRTQAQALQGEAKEVWKEASPSLQELEQRLKEGIDSVRGELESDELKLQVRLAVMQAREKWKEVEPRVTPVVDTILRATANVGAAVEDAVGQVAPVPGESPEEAQARQARAQEQRERVKHEVREAGKSVEDAARVALTEMRGAFERLRSRLG